MKPIRLLDKSAAGVLRNGISRGLNESATMTKDEIRAEIAEAEKALQKVKDILADGTLGNISGIAGLNHEQGEIERKIAALRARLEES